MPSVRPSRYGDVGELSGSLRQADVEELKALGVTPDKALLTGFLASRYCYTGLDDQGAVICMFGVVDNHDDGLMGTIWLLGSDAIPKVTLAFLRETKKYLGLFQEQYDMLANIVDCRNTTHCHWLKWCGFVALRTVSINGLPFFEFVRIKTHV